MRGRPLNRPTGFQTPADRQPPRRPCVEPIISALIHSVRADGNGDVKRATDFEPKEALGCDADDLGRMAIERDDPPDCRPVAAELALPERVADDGIGWAAAASIVVCREEATEHGMDAEHTEEIAAHPQRARISHLAARREVERAAAPRKHAGERLLLG